MSMETPQSHKMMTPGNARVETKRPEQEAEETYLFPGKGRYRPHAVRAPSRKEAEKRWREERTAVDISSDVNEDKE